MHATLVCGTALSFLLGAAVACSPAKPHATDEQGRAEPEAAGTAPTGGGLPPDAVPGNMQLVSRLEADLVGNGLPAIVLVASNEDHHELRVLARSRALEGDGLATGIIDSLTLDSSPYGPPTVSVAKRVLVVDHATGGANSTRATYRYRFDEDADRMRLIGLDLERHVRTVSHDTLSWNLLTGARIVRPGRAGENSASGEAAFRYGPEQDTKLAVPPVYMAQTPNPDQVLDEALGSLAGGQCGENDVACQETTYQLEETLFLYEAAVAKAIGDAARPCWSDDVAAFRRGIEECGDPDCRQARLRERLASLSDLQPPTHRAEIRLPSQVPLLIAVLGPENGTGADDEAVPLVARGDLVHASNDPEHMGLAVRDGRHEHVIVFDIDLGDQPGHDAIMGLVGTSPTTRVLARGYRRMAPDGTANFDTGRCRQVYQLVQ
jgi:hypothetical protein